MTSLSAERNQGSEEEAESSTEEEIPDQLNRHSSGGSESYRAETPRRSVPESSSFNPRRRHTSLTPAAIDDHALGEPYDLERRASQTSCRQVSHQLSYRSISNIAETREPIQGVTPRQALRDMNKKFAELEEEKELAVWSQKLADMEAKKAAGFSTFKNSEVEAENETIAQKIHRKSKLALPIVEVYSGQTYGHYQSYVRSCEYVFDTRPTTYRLDTACVLYGVGVLRGTPSTTWYRYAEVHGRLSISWLVFKKFLLDDLLPPSIRLRDVHKKYREAKQRLGQSVHSLIRYLEELEA